MPKFPMDAPLDRVLAAMSRLGFQIVRSGNAGNGERVKDSSTASGGRKSAVWLDAQVPFRPVWFGRVALARGTYVRPLAVYSTCGGTLRFEDFASRRNAIPFNSS